ncbi:hypothetical protein Ac2012v2_000415 [Leucoagaricus gongylophorus]
MIPRVGCASRSLAVRAASLRQFHGNTIIHDKVGDKVREMGQKVNLKMGQGLASAIDKGEKATYATKEKLSKSLLQCHPSHVTYIYVEEGQGYVEKKADDAAKGTQKVKEDLKQESK